MFREQALHFAVRSAEAANSYLNVGNLDWAKARMQMAQLWAEVAKLLPSEADTAQPTRTEVAKLLPSEAEHPPVVENDNEDA